MNLVERSCPLCGSVAESSVFVKASFDLDRLDTFGFASRKMPEFMHYQLMRCAKCDLVYSSPAPVEGDLAGAYESAAFDSGEEARYAALTYRKYTSRFLKELPDRKYALDIGTGDGAYLEQLLDLGFESVLGIEPSQAPIASAKPAIRPFIRQGLFSAKELAGICPTLITCFQTIEHVSDPLQLCSDAHQLLSRGGALLIVAHNRRALSARLLKERSPIFDIEHLQLFTVVALREMLIRARFTRIRTFSIWNRYPIQYLVKLSPIAADKKGKLLGFLKRTGLGGMPISLPLGNIGVVGFKGR